MTTDPAATYTCQCCLQPAQVTQHPLCDACWARVPADLAKRMQRAWTDFNLCCAKSQRGHLLARYRRLRDQVFAVIPPAKAVSESTPGSI